MNALDAALLVLIVGSTVLGVIRGLIREAIAILSVVGSILIAFLLAPAAMRSFGDGPAVYAATAVIVFVVSLIGFALAGRLLKGVTDLLHLGGVDRFFGGLFGFARAAAIGVAGLVLVVMVVNPEDPFVRESQLLKVAAPGVEWLGSRIPLDQAREVFEDHWHDLDLDASPLDRVITT